MPKILIHAYPEGYQEMVKLLITNPFNPANVNLDSEWVYRGIPCITRPIWVAVKSKNFKLLLEKHTQKADLQPWIGSLMKEGLIQTKCPKYWYMPMQKGTWKWSNYSSQTHLIMQMCTMYQSRGFGFETLKTVGLSEEALKSSSNAEFWLWKKYQLSSKGQVRKDMDLMHPFPTIVFLMTLLQQVLKCIDPNSASRDTETATASGQGGQGLGLTGHNESSLGWNCPHWHWFSSFTSCSISCRN